MEKFAQIHRLMALLFSRRVNHRVDVVFAPGRADRDWQATEGDSGILELAAEMYFAGQAPVIAIPSTRGGATFSGPDNPNTYPGPEVWTTHLKSLKVKESSIIITDPAPPHTRGDTDSVVKLCVHNDWPSMAIIMQPHQVLRTMLAILQSLQRYQCAITVIPVCPHEVNWHKEVYTSQGTNLRPRIEQAEGESQRIVEGQEQQWLATFDRLERYLGFK